MDAHRLSQIQERYRTLSAFHRAQVERWIQDAKMTFYDHGRPYGTRLQPPSGIPRLSARSMFELLYLAMDKDQTRSPPHTPPRDNYYM
jgi:hypothetical protein